MLEFQDVVMLVQLLVIVVLAFRLRGAIPLEETRALLKEAQEAAEKTHTRIDDALVDFAMMLFGVVEEEQTKPPEEEEPQG